jgi:hypothetical protein
MFIDKEFRNKVVEYCKDPAVKSYWTEEFANYTERFAAEALPAIQNKIGQFTGNPLIRNIIGQPHSSFDIRQMMDEKKILIMNLSKGLIGETNANLLGSMLTTRIYLAAMSRADLPVDVMKKMPNFYFYVDEFQSFANSTFANILSEARKYHLNLIIAHQYVDQMEEDVRSAVFGNVGTTIAFRVGPFDAEVLETVFAPQFTAIDLVNLGFAQIYLSLMIDGVGSQPFSAITLPPLERPPISFRDMAVAGSRTNFAKKRADVEQIVIDLHTPTPKAPKKDSDDKRSAKKPPNNNGGGNGTSSAPKSEKPAVRNNNDTRRTPPKPPVQAKRPEDLKAILSRMSQSNTTPEKRANKEPSPAKSDLKSALASVLKAEETAAPVVSEPVPPPPVQKETPPPATPPRRATPSFTPASVRDNLDPTVIKRMLRDEKQDRSPFA